MRFVLGALIPSLFIICAGLVVVWYVARAWRDWDSTGELGTGYWQTLAGLTFWAYRWPASDRDQPLEEVTFRSRWLVLAWLSICVAVAVLLVAAGVAWLFVGARWGAGSTPNG